MSRKRKSRVAPKLVLGAGAGLGVLYLLGEFATPNVSIALVIAGILAAFIVPSWRRISSFAPGHLYVFTVRHPRTGRKVCGYVGKTRRDPKIRYEEHLGNGRYGDEAKPWTDTITDWRVIYSSKNVSDVGLSIREQLHIRFRRPLYNYTYNTGNSRRIKPREAKAQRAARNR